MNLYDAAAARDIADAIDAALAAFSPRGMDMNALNRAYAELVRASGTAKELYARIVEAHPIIAIEKEEPQAGEETSENNQKAKAEEE